MAAVPPTPGPGPQGPRPPLSVVPGNGAPPPGPPGGPPPPPGPPPQSPPPAAGGGLGATPPGPFASLLSDVSADLSPGWQSVDIAVRALKIALRSVDFQRTPKVVAQIQSQMNTLNTLVTSYTMGVQSGPATPTIERNSAQDTGAADADSAPAATNGGDVE